MIRLAMAGLLALTLAALAAADDPRPEDPEPPVRLKKKARPPKKSEEKPAPKKEAPKEKQEAEPAEPNQPGESEKEILERIEKNLRQSTERLGKQDTGEGTRQGQRDVVKDLEALIEHTRRQQQQQQQDQQPSAGAPGGRKSKDRQQASRKSSGSRQERKKRSGNPRDRQGQNAQAKNKSQGGAGKTDNDGPSKIAEMYKERWGELPETLRMEMDAYARERFMARYSELLKQYYSTIAERGRRREGDR